MKKLLRLTSAIFAAILLVVMVLPASADGSPNQFVYRFYDTRLEGDMYNQPYYVENGKRVYGGHFTLTFRYPNPHTGAYWDESSTFYAPVGTGPNDYTVYHTPGNHYRRQKANGEYIEYSGRYADYNFVWIPENIWPNEIPSGEVEK